MGHGRFAAPGTRLAASPAPWVMRVQRRGTRRLLPRRLLHAFHRYSPGRGMPAMKIDRVPADLGARTATNASRCSSWRCCRSCSRSTSVCWPIATSSLRCATVAVDPLAASIERIWLDDLAERYGAGPEQIYEMVLRVDIVPPSMAIAQGGVEVVGAHPSPRAPAMRCSARSSRSAATASRCHGSRATACRSLSQASASPPRRTSPTSTPIPPMPLSAARAPRARAERGARGLPADRHAAALFRARPGVRAVRAPDHARERTARFRQGQLSGF